MLILRKTIVVGLVFVSSLSVAAQTKKPELSLTDVYGRAFNLSDYRGKVVLINFWATWCPPCRTEMPELIKLQRQYQHAGLQVIGVTYPPEKLSDVRRFGQKIKINYPLALGNKGTKLLFTESDVLPITIVVDRNGEVRDMIEGILLPEEFDQKIKPVLSEQLSTTPKRVQAKRASQVQKMTIIVTSDGYTPATIRLQKSAPTQLTFIRTTEDTCGTQIVIPAYGISRSLPLNERVTVRFKPSRRGVFKFTCGMDMFRGSIVVR